MNSEIIELLREIRDTLSSIDDQLYAIKIQCEEMRDDMNNSNVTTLENLSNIQSKLEDVTTAVTGISI